jgi:uncharacterized protein (TIGR02594 family)
MPALTSTPTLLDVWRSRLGVEEIKGKKHNPIILQWWQDAGHPEIVDDETAWCSGSMCSAAKEAGLPFPPVNVNTMARSWLTQGVKVDPADVQPGDVTIWPRGNPNGPYGHVNCVSEVKRLKKKTLVKCIGGNQSHPSGGAVTETDWTDISGVLPNGIRRLVPVSAPALQRAGSTEVKKGNQLKKIGILGSFVGPIIAAVKELFGAATEVPQFADLPEQLTWWQSVVGGMNAIGQLVIDNPWLAGTTIISIAVAWIGHTIIKHRLAKHASGAPIAAEVARLEMEFPDAELEAA